MTCAAVEHAIDDIVAGNVPVAAELAQHIASCARCQASLALARRVEAVLAEPAPAAPASFSASVMRRVRRDAWRAEQMVDRFFNWILVAGLVLVAGGVWMVLNAAGMADAFRQLSSALTGGITITVRNDPHVWAYALSVVLLLTGAGAWWWIEREA